MFISLPLSSSSDTHSPKNCFSSQCGARMRFICCLLFVDFLRGVTPAAHGLVSVSNVTAECGTSVAIHCNVSTWRDELSVKHLEWSLNHKPLCQVDSKGELNHSKNTKSDFHCEYEKGQLSLIFANVLPEDSGASNRYMCKLRSNRGISHGYSWIELQECCGMVKGVLSKDGPVCIFSYVYPDGDVLWTHDSQIQSEEPLIQSTFKSVEDGGWVTIRSQINSNSSGGFTCNLTSINYGRQIACNLSEGTEFFQYGLTTPLIGNGAGSLGPSVTLLLISSILVVMHK